MNPRLFGTAVALVAALATVTCKEDPTAALSGDATRLLISPNPVFLSEGGTGNFTVSAVNDALRPIRVEFTATSGDLNTATVAASTVAPDPNGTSQRFELTAVAPGQVLVTVSAAGLSAQDTVNVLPVAFGGAVSSTTPAGGDTVTIASTAVLKFDPAAVHVALGDVSATILDATADQLTFLMPFATPGPLTLDGIVVTYVAGLTTSLPTADDFTVTGDLWGGDDAIGTAPSIPIPAAAGTSTFVLTNTTEVDNSASCPEVVLAFGSSGPCMIYRFDLAAPTSLQFTVDWDGDADVDIYVCPDADPNNCFEDGGDGATAAHPEITGATFSAGPHYLFIEVYDGAPPKNIYVTIARQ